MGSRTREGNKSFVVAFAAALLVAFAGGADARDPVPGNGSAAPDAGEADDVEADQTDDDDLAEAAPPDAELEAPAPPDADPTQPLVVTQTGTPPIPASMPETYAVMTFQNRSGHASYDWMNAAVPFVLGEKVERHRALRPAYGSLVVGGMPPNRIDARSVRAFAEKQGARWVFAGWIDRMENWDLQLGIELWRVSSGNVRKVGAVVGRDDFNKVHELTGKAVEELCKRAGMPVDAIALAEAYREPTSDHYAFTLFGRGLAFLTGTLGWVDLTRAEKNLARSVFIDPKLAEAHRMLAALYAKTGKKRSARLALDRALAQRSDYYAALVAQVDAEYARGKLERVRAMNRTMIQLRPWDLERRYQLGKVLWELGDLDEALIELDRVVAIQPNDIRARRILALIHASRGEPEQLVDALTKVAALDPKDVPTRLDLAAAYLAAKRPDDAIRSYEAVLALEPDNHLALKFLGDLHSKAGRRDAAIRYYRRAVRTDPSDPRPYFRLGAAYVAAGDDRNAKRIYRRAQRFKRYLGQVYSNLGAIAYREGNVAESLWYLRRAVKRVPKDATIRYNLALSLSKHGLADDAVEQIEAGLALAPRHVDLHFLRGVILLRRGDADGARAAFARVLALAPDHDDARHNLALLDEMRRRTEAGEVVRR